MTEDFLEKPQLAGDDKRADFLRLAAERAAAAKLDAVRKQLTTLTPADGKLDCPYCHAGTPEGAAFCCHELAAAFNFLYREAAEEVARRELAQIAKRRHPPRLLKAGIHYRRR